MLDQLTVVAEEGEKKKDERPKPFVGNGLGGEQVERRSSSPPPTQRKSTVRLGLEERRGSACLRSGGEKALERYLR